MRICNLLFFASLILFSPSSALSQTTDSRTLQSILDEIHRLRQELRTTSASAQRSQILLHRVRLQMDVVERVTQRLDRAHARATQQKNELDQFQRAAKEFEERTATSQNPEQRKELDQEFARFQTRLEQLKVSIPEEEAKEATLTNELRNEQAKLEEFQEQLDRLDKKLQGEEKQADPN